MNKGFYPRLAAQNLKKNSRYYVPYLLTVAGTVAAFYILCALASSRDLPEHQRYVYLSAFMAVGLFVVGLFALIFLFYTNSFLMKRRSKELGLYNILGMGKGNLAAMLAWETLYTALLGITGGVALGIVLQKLMTMLLFRLMGYSGAYGFSVSPFAIGVSYALFSAILLLALLRNLARIRVQNPVALLRGGETGEREPRTRWVLTILGVLTLGAGYWIAVTTKTALDALSLYFVAVILVVLGTYCLFTAVSIFVLKALRKNKKYYYRTAHFIGVSGMLYRMKRNAVGLANICILSTMVLVMVSGTLALYLGTGDAMQERYPADICAEVRYAPGGSDPFRPDAMLAHLKSGAEKAGRTVTRADSYLYLSFGAAEADGGFTVSGAETDRYLYATDAAGYRTITGKTLAVRPGEVWAAGGPAAGDSLLLNFLSSETGKAVQAREYTVAGQLEPFSLGDALALDKPVVILVLPDAAALEDLYAAQKSALGDACSDLYFEGLLDLDGTDQQKIDCGLQLSDPGYLDVVSSGSARTGGLYSSDTVKSGGASGQGENVGYWDLYMVSTRAESEQEMYSLNGGFLFLGIFLGILFMMGTVLIMYYKQVAEGYEDRARFQIMQQVGLPKPEIRRSINRQLLVVFFAPLLVAAVHVAFDYRLIVLLLTLFGLRNVSLTLLCTAGTLLAFAALYALVYAMTARAYYKIVK
jgi:putative ABC transport system permease protein